MHLSNRKSKIVFELLNNDDCITGQHIANVTGVTTRTIRGDIAELNEEFKQYGVHISSVAGKGYYISEDKKEELSSLISTQQDYVMPIMPESRQEHILKQIILHPEGVSSDVISKQLYVSKSTLQRDFANVKKTLLESGVYLTRKTGDILTVTGDELLIRKMYKDFFDNGISAHSLDENVLNGHLNSIFIKIKEIVRLVDERENIELTGDEFNNTVLWLMIAVFRNINNFCLNNFSAECLEEGRVSTELVECIESEFEIGLNTHERNYIKYFLKGLAEKRVKRKNNIDLKNLVVDAASKVSKTFEYDLGNELCEKLYDIFAIEGHTKSSEYELVEIEREYPLAFEMAVSLVNLVKNQLNMDAYNDILVKIILLFASDMEQSMLEEETKKRDVVVICQSGELSANLIKTKLSRYFPGFNVLGFFPLYRIDKALDMNPELIISTVMIECDSAPVIVINPLFKDYDAVKINAVLRKAEYDGSSYEFLNLFKEELFIKGIDAFDKYDVIKKLFDKMRLGGFAQESFFQSVVERENISSTAIGNMVAVPHAISGGIGENVVVVGILDKPIKWNNDKVQLVFLINIKNTSGGNVKQIFKSFFDVISAGGKVERLIKSKNYYEFLKTINQ